MNYHGILVASSLGSQGPLKMGQETNQGFLPSGKRLQKTNWKDPPLRGKFTISMAMFNSYVKLPEGKWMFIPKCMEVIQVLDPPADVSRLN